MTFLGSSLPKDWKLGLSPFPVIVTTRIFAWGLWDPWEYTWILSPLGRAGKLCQSEILHLEQWSKPLWHFIMLVVFLVYILVMVYEIISIWTWVVSSPVYPKQPGAFFLWFIFFSDCYVLSHQKNPPRKKPSKTGRSLGKTLLKNMNIYIYMIYLHDPFMVYR